MWHHSCTKFTFVKTFVLLVVFVGASLGAVGCVASAISEPQASEEKFLSGIKVIQPPSVVGTWRGYPAVLVAPNLSVIAAHVHKRDVKKDERIVFRSRRARVFSVTPLPTLDEKKCGKIEKDDLENPDPLFAATDVAVIHHETISNVRPARLIPVTNSSSAAVVAYSARVHQRRVPIVDKAPNRVLANVDYAKIWNRCARTHQFIVFKLFFRSQKMCNGDSSSIVLLKDKVKGDFGLVSVIATHGLGAYNLPRAKGYACGATFRGPGLAQHYVGEWLRERRKKACETVPRSDWCRQLLAGTL